MDQIVSLAKAIKELSTSSLLIVVSPLLMMIAIVAWQTYEMSKLFNRIAEASESSAEVRQEELAERRMQNQRIITIMQALAETNRRDAEVDTALLNLLNK